MRQAKIDRPVLEIDDDPVERLRHDPHRLDRGDGGDRPESGAALAPHPFEAVERWQRCHGKTPADCRRKLTGHAGTRPPKNGISAWLSVCGFFDVKIISAPAPSKTSPGLPIRSTTRRAIAGAGSIQSTGQGASFASRSSSSG